MEISVHPPTGVGDIRFGEDFQSVADRLRAIGDLRNASPTPKRSTFKSTLVLSDFEITLSVENGHVAAVALWRFENDAPGVFVHYRGLDLFRTPARVLAERISTESGSEAVTPESEITIFPDLSLLLSRDTSRDVPLDDEDSLPLYVHYVLAAPAGYFD